MRLQDNDRGLDGQQRENMEIRDRKDRETFTEDTGANSLMDKREMRMNSKYCGVHIA